MDSRGAPLRLLRHAASELRPPMSRTTSQDRLSPRFSWATSSCTWQPAPSSAVFCSAFHLEVVPGSCRIRRLRTHLRGIGASGTACSGIKVGGSLVLTFSCGSQSWACVRARSVAEFEVMNLSNPACEMAHLRMAHTMSYRQGAKAQARSFEATSLGKMRTSRAPFFF